MYLFLINKYMYLLRFLFLEIKNNKNVFCTSVSSLVFRASAVLTSTLSFKKERKSEAKYVYFKIYCYFCHAL